MKLFAIKLNYYNSNIESYHFQTNISNQKLMDKLSEEDIDNCMQAFKDLDEDGTDYIKVQDLKLALGRVYIELSDQELFKTISEVDVDNTGRVAFENFLEIYYQKKILPGLDDQKQDLIDAFNAVGGGPGEEGSVDAE